jgi:hypothetical protein
MHSYLTYLAHRLEKRAAIVEHGKFLGLATDVIVAGERGIRYFKEHFNLERKGEVSN